MLSVALLVFTLSGLCRGDSENSPPVAVSQRQSQAQVVSLRRQLMRDNYDYQHSGDEQRRPDLNERGVERWRRTERGDDGTKPYNQTGGADHLLPSSKLPQSNTKLNAEHSPREHYEQRDQHDQPGHYEQNQRRQEVDPHEQLSNKENRGQTEQPHDHEQPHQHERQEPHNQENQFNQLGQNNKYKRASPREHREDPQQRGRYEQSGQRVQPSNYTRQNQYKRTSEPKRGLFEKNGQLQQHEQFEQSGHNVQSHQYEHLFKYDQLGPRKRPRESDQEEQPNEHKQRESREGGTQSERRYQQVGRGPHQQRGQYRRPKRFREVGRYPGRGESDQREFDDQQEHSVERINRVARPLYDAPPHSPVQHANHPDWPAEYYNKRRETYETPMLRRPFGDLRSNYKEPHPLPPEERAQNSAQFNEQELSPEDREAFERQEMSGSEDEDSDLSKSQRKQITQNHRFRPQTRTRADRLQYYTPPPTHRSRPSGNVPLTYAEYDASPEQGPRSNIALDHISEKNLLYYQDEHQLRRRKIDRSLGLPASNQDQSTEDVVSSPQPSADSRHSTVTRASPVSSRAGPSYSTTRSGSVTPFRTRPVGSRTSGTSSRSSPPSPHIKPALRPATTAPPDRARTERSGSYVVTVSENNVTYKIITLKSRDGRRQAKRRMLEERGPAGVALVSLDGAPLPALRLPRSRRQYMHHRRRRRRRPA